MFRSLIARLARLWRAITSTPVCLQTARPAWIVQKTVILMMIRILKEASESEGETTDPEAGERRSIQAAAFGEDAVLTENEPLWAIFQSDDYEELLGFLKDP